jgi:putative DNA primase/helicase
LEQACEAVGNVKFVCFDALTSYMGRPSGGFDNSGTTDVRGVLEPVGDFAKKIGIAVVGIMHPPKAHQANALFTFSGSLAYVAAARLVFCTTTEPVTGRRLFLAVKNNLGPDAPGIGYLLATKIISQGILAPYVLWDDRPVDVTANEALAQAAQALKGPSELDRAIAFLRELLAGGPVAEAACAEAADEADISTATLKRAKRKLGVVSAKEHGVPDGPWHWRLP